MSQLIASRYLYTLSINILWISQYQGYKVSKNTCWVEGWKLKGDHLFCEACWEWSDTHIKSASYHVHIPTEWCNNNVNITWDEGDNKCYLCQITPLKTVNRDWLSYTHPPSLSQPFIARVRPLTRWVYIQKDNGNPYKCIKSPLTGVQPGISHVSYFS